MSTSNPDDPNAGDYDPDPNAPPDPWASPHSQPPGAPPAGHHWEWDGGTWNAVADAGAAPAPHEDTAPKTDGGGGGGGKSSTSEPTNPYAGGGNVPSMPVNTGGFDKLIEMLMAQNQHAMDLQDQDRAAKAEWSQKVRANIMSALDEAKRPVTADDPIIAQQVQTQDFQNQRTLQMAREAAAARGAAGGGPTSGAADAAVQSGVENLGIAKNSLVSRLMADEVDKRRQNAQHLVDTEAGVLGGDEAVSAQRDLGVLGNLVTSLRDKSNTMDANRNMDITSALGFGGLSNQFMGLSNQNGQFYDQLGYNAAHDSAILNYLYSQLAGA